MVEYIIDGCNYIKFFQEVEEGDFEGRKQRLISRLHSYASPRQVGITAVFDSRRPSRDIAGKVEVIHTRDADSRIVEEVGKKSSPAAVTVVSNDRALIREIKDLGASGMSVRNFRDFLEKKLSGKEKGDQTTEKPSPEGMSRAEVKWWKKEMGLD